MQPSTSLTRRGLLATLAALGGLVMAFPFGAALGWDVRRLPTPKQTRGPFYPKMRPLDQDMDLTLVEGRVGRARGQVVHLAGRVLNSNGDPVSGARIELWQANAAGRYSHPDDTNPAPLDPNFQGYATQLTDEEGRYRFKTIKPGAYPVNPRQPDAVRTPHIHFDVVAAKQHLITQMYFPGEPLNAEDGIFSRLGANQDAAVAKLLAPTPEIEPDALLVQWDIVLGAG